MPRSSASEPRYYFKEVRFRQIRAFVATPQAGEPLVIRDISRLAGYERLVLLHPKGRHERAHVEAFRERVAGTMR